MVASTCLQKSRKLSSRKMVLNEKFCMNLGSVFGTWRGFEADPLMKRWYLRPSPQRCQAHAKGAPHTEICRTDLHLDTFQNRIRGAKPKTATSKRPSLFLVPTSPVSPAESASPQLLASPPRWKYASPTFLPPQTALQMGLGCGQRQCSDDLKPDRTAHPEWCSSQRLGHPGLQ